MKKVIFLQVINDDLLLHNINYLMNFYDTVENTQGSFVCYVLIK